MPPPTSARRMPSVMLGPPAARGLALALRGLGSGAAEADEIRRVRRDRRGSPDQRRRRRVDEEVVPLERATDEPCTQQLPALALVDATTTRLLRHDVLPQTTPLARGLPAARAPDSVG